MAVRPKLIATVFAATTMVVVASALVTYLFGNNVLRFHRREELRRETIAALEQLASTLKDAETGQRGFVITGDERYLEPYEGAIKRLPQEMEKFKAARGVDINETDLETIANLVEQKLTEVRSTIELRRGGGLEAAVAVIRGGTGKQIMDNLRSEVARVQSKQLAALRRDSALSDQVTRTRTVVFLLTGAINVLVLAWAYQRIAESIRQRDVALTEARTRGTELERQKDLLGVTLASIGDCVMVADTDGRITFMNRVAEEVTGWSFEEARGRQTAEVFHILGEHTRQPAEDPVKKVIKQGAIVGLGNHTLLIRKDGRELPIDDSGAPIRDPDGTIRGVVLVFRDFSERRRAQDELQKAKEAAETANRAKDQFLAMLSHELRTPLTPVLATLNLWEASEDLPARLQPDVQMLRRSVELEARIIDDLLDLTRIARGMLSFSPENVDVHALLEFIVDLSQSEIQDKRLQIVLHLEALRHNVHTDVARLQQVLWNILRNAIKFTEAGGHITVATSNDPQQNIEIAVSDTGIGMAPETIARLFVPFEQAQPGRHPRYGGLGLGMAISSALVDLLDGKLTAKSPGLGKGSTFTVAFATTESTATAIQLDRLPSIARETINLLLVEDHVDTARALVRLLENRGYRITSVPTVAAALEAIEREQFDLLLCDLGLPDGTGVELIEKVRRTSQTPAVALTGFGMEQDVQRARQAGFDAHLTKPVNLQKLEATMLKLLQERQATS